MVQPVGVHSAPEQESGSEQQRVAADGTTEVTQPNGAAGLAFVEPFNTQRTFLPMLLVAEDSLSRWTCLLWIRRVLIHHVFIGYGTFSLIPILLRFSSLKDVTSPSVCTSFPLMAPETQHQSCLEILAPNGQIFRREWRNPH